MQFPTTYEMEPIGVDRAYEATRALHFCSEACRDSFEHVIGQHYINGYEPSTVDGEVCEQCGKTLENK